MWVEGQNGTGGGDPLTPSNSTPQAIVQDNVYEAQGNGYAIESYRNVTPDDGNPPLVNEGELIKINSFDGYLQKSLYEHEGAYYAKGAKLTDIYEDSLAPITTEDGVLDGTIEVSWNTAKSSEVTISVISRYEYSSGNFRSKVIAGTTAPSLAGNKKLILNVYGVFIPKGSIITFSITAQSGGTRSLNKLMSIYKAVKV